MIWRTLSREMLELVHFHQLLMRQGRPKICILRFEQIQGLLHHPCIQAMVAGLPAPSADQPFGPFFAIGSATAV